MAAPAQPTAILRGHSAQVNATEFVRAGADGHAVTPNTRLATGDSDGFVILWDLAIVRPRAVWRAHTNSILGLAGWDDADQIVTHGRDHKLIVWQVGIADEARLSTTLPLEDDSLVPPSSSPKRADEQTDHRPAPWIVFVLNVNTMNFCAFAWCRSAGVSAATRTAGETLRSEPTSTSHSAERLVAVPNALTLEAVDIFHFPSQQRVNTIKLGTREGMIMALALFYHRGETPVLIAAFENGVTTVASLDSGVDSPATIRYRAQPHAQPILSLDVSPDQSYYLTSAADAVVAKHPIPVYSREGSPSPTTAIDADQSFTPDESVRRHMPKEGATDSAVRVSLLSAALAKEAASPRSARPQASRPAPPEEPETQPRKVVDTKHAGQQSLRIRKDGRIFATAGWDGRVRVYSAKSMKEVAVLKWHQAGCFAVAFAPVTSNPPYQQAQEQAGYESSKAVQDSSETSLVSNMGTRREVSVKERRLRHSLTAHWLAAGSKDGKISLWDIF